MNNKILISGGDSFIYGLDLPDCVSPTFNSSNLTWVSKLSTHLNRNHICAAFPGLSNSGICRLTMNQCMNNLDKDLFVAVSWTFLNRFELKFIYKYYTGSPKEAIFGEWCNFNHYDINDARPYTNSYKPEVLKFLKDFYENVGYGDDYELYVTLKEIYLLQSFLKLNKIPYVFTCANNFFTKKNMDISIKNLLKNIDFNNWFFYPDATGFVQWANRNNYPKKDEHPGVEAHTDSFIYIKDFLNEKV